MSRELHARKNRSVVWLVAIAVALTAVLGGCAAQEQEAPEGVQAQEPAETAAAPGTASGPETGDASEPVSAASAAKASVEDYTWDELSRISAEIAAAGDEAAAIAAVVCSFVGKKA